MNQIRERCHLIYRNEAKSLAVFVSKSQQSLRTIAAATGIPKSSVHRHLRNIKQRQSYAESHLWETKEGGDWLRLLVFAVIYCFGIRGIGSESLSAFFGCCISKSRVFCQCLERTGSTAQRTNHRLWTSPSRGKSWRATDRHLGR